MNDRGSSHGSSTVPLLPLGAPGSSGNAPPPGAIDDATVISNKPPLTAAGANLVQDLIASLIGERLDHFELTEFVGGGGMGAVFRATDTLLNRQVAVKVLSRDQATDDETRRRFRNEAQSAARLDHDNIARVYYVGEDKGVNYIVFEYIEGQNLRQRVEQHGGPLPLAEAISYTMQVARALDHACNRDVVHRDIKPSNVLITAEGKAKLVDMGLARLHQVDASGMDLTASGVTLGTFDYISPEQARDPRSADVRSDIYSLGCTLYFMLTSRPPFPEGTVLQKLLQHNSDDPPDPREFNSELPEEITRIMNRMLAKHPRQRYQTPMELAADLADFADRFGLSDGAWSADPSLPRIRREPSWLDRHLPWLAPVVLLLAAVVVIELFSTRGSSPPPFAGETGSALTTTAPSPTAAAPEPTSDIPPLPPLALSNLQSGATQVPMPPVVTADAVTGVVPAAPTSPASTTSDPKTLTTSAIPLREGVLVVTPEITGRQQYTSLRAACAAASHGEIIELRYNGARTERPFSLNNANLTIRAADGFQPTVVFRPGNDEALTMARGMLGVSGGALTLFNVQFELQVPSQWDVPAERWSLFELRRCESIEFQSCVLTVKNTTELMTENHPDVAVFHVGGAPGLDGMMSMDDAPSEPPMPVSMGNSVVRGECSLIRATDGQSLDFQWDNGLAAIGGRFLVVEGSTRSPRDDERVSVTLRHVTAVVRSGFGRITAGIDRPYAIPVSVRAMDAILAGGGSVPLFDVEARQSVESLAALIDWNGERVFYQGFSSNPFIMLIDLNSPSRPFTSSFDDWRAKQHESFESWGQVMWKRLNRVERPLDERVPADYALDDSSADNPALGGASDGHDAGMSRVSMPLMLESSPAAPALTPLPMTPAPAK